MRNKPQELDDQGSGPVRYNDYPGPDNCPLTPWEKFKQLFDRNKD